MCQYCRSAFSRRAFLGRSALAGGSLLMAGAATPLLAKEKKPAAPAKQKKPAASAQNTSAPEKAAKPSAPAKAEKSTGIKVRGYAAMDESGKLVPWEFERRAVGDDDILIDIKYASICHSDIHQEKGDWGKQQYPQVPGHEIVGIVAEVGKNVSAFKVGDRAGVGCMVGSCLVCEACKQGLEQHCERQETLWTYGSADKREPSGITQGGYSTRIVVPAHFAVHIPEALRLQDAAPLLCAGITTYSPLMKYGIKEGTKVGVAGIGGLGHMAVMLAASKGAEVYAFTTSPKKVDAIRSLGAKEVVVVSSLDRLRPYKGALDYMIATIPEQFDVAAYAACVKPFGTFTTVGMAKGFRLDVNAAALAGTRVNFNASLIGGMKETQELVNYCAEHNITPQVQMIAADKINEAWENVQAKKALFRYVIDAATF